jgi:hypothetical protein
MKIAKLAAALFLASLCSSAMAQEKYAHLKSWEGKYPTYNKSPRKFFTLPEVRVPLKRLLSRRVFFLLTKGHTKEGPIKITGNYLKVVVCGSPESYGCDNITMLVIDLHDGSIYVAFDIHSPEPRYFATKGKFSDLPQDIRAAVRHPNLNP